MNGFGFTEMSGDFPEDCSKINVFLSKLVILNSYKNARTKDIAPYLEKCRIQMSPDLVNLSKVAGAQNIEEELTEVLSTPGYGIKQKVRLRSIMRVRERNSVTFNYWKELKLILDFRSKKDASSFKGRSELFRFLREEKKCLNRIKSPFYRDLFALAIAVKTDNTAFMEKIAKNLIKTGPMELALTWGGTKNPIKVEKKVGILNDLIKRFKEKIGDKLVVKILVDRIVQLGQSVEYKTLLNDFDADWSLTDLREITSSLGTAREYFDFWYGKFLNRTSDNEVNQFLKRVLSVETIKKAKASQLWIFEHYLPNEDKIRQIIAKRFLTMWKSRDLYQRYIVLRAISKEPYKRLMITEEEDFKRALFQLERDFFHEVLETGVAVDFALFQLYQLGDKDDQNLWWYVL